MASMKFRKYYIKGNILPFEEDQKTEFKGHVNLCKEEIPPWAEEKKHEKASRKTISRQYISFVITVFLLFCYSNKLGLSLW